MYILCGAWVVSELADVCALDEACALVETQFVLTTGRRSKELSMSQKQGLQPKKAFGIFMRAPERPGFWKFLKISECLKKKIQTVFANYSILHNLGPEAPPRRDWVSRSSTEVISRPEVSQAQHLLHNSYYIHKQGATKNVWTRGKKKKK